MARLFTCGSINTRIGTTSDRQGSPPRRFRPAQLSRHFGRKAIPRLEPLWLSGTSLMVPDGLQPPQYRRTGPGLPLRLPISATGRIAAQKAVAALAIT